MPHRAWAARALAPVSLALAPVSLRAARQFVASHHRHNLPPRGWLFGVSLVDGADVVQAVAIAGRPVARGLQDGRTVEVLRVCTLGDRNAPSRLYGAICRAATALGYRRAITYTLATESGVSLRAAGFTIDAVLDPRDTWASASNGGRYDETLWGDRTLPDASRIRWKRLLA